MIGLIVKTDLEANELPSDWIPESLEVDLIERAFLEIFDLTLESEKLSIDKNGILIHFTIDDVKDPKSIIFTCIASPPQSDLVNFLADRLSAKIFDSESCEFIRL